VNRADAGVKITDRATVVATMRNAANSRAYSRQYTPDLRSIKRKSIMPLRRLAVSGWRRFSRALICFSVYSQPGSMSWTRCMSTAPNVFRCIGSCRSEPSLRACRCCSSISRKVISLEEAAREPFVVYSQSEYPDYHEWFQSIFTGIAQKPRIVEEHNGASSLLPAVEAGIGVASVYAVFPVGPRDR
jgi:hypothetical protein